MQKTLFALAFGLASTSFAGSLNLDMRADYSSTSYKESVLPDSNRFYLKTGRLDYNGKVLEDISFRVRWAFAKDATVLKTDNAQKALELAYLSHKLSDNFTLTLGRLNTEFGGFEGMNGSPDLYLTSEFYTQSGPNGNLPGDNYGTAALLYMTGIKATYSTDNHLFHLLATNENIDEAAAQVNQDAPMVGVVWRGNFFEKGLGTTLSYHTQKGDNSGDRHQFMAAGLMWRGSQFMAVADYLVSTFKLDSANETDSVTSVVGKIAYLGWENWMPRLEITSSEEKHETGAAEKNKYFGYGAVVEYYPYTDKNFRYQVAFTNVELKPETGNRVTRQEIVVGTRLLADFLK